MIAVALKGLARRKLRAALTALAIVLGVAMISGTYILTDTIKSAFGTVFTQVYKHTDVVVTGKSAIGGDEHGGGGGGGGARTTPSISESLLASVRGLPGVQEAQGGISDTAQLVGRNGKVISSGGAPGLAFSVHAHGNQRFNPLQLVAGTWPSGAGEVAIDANTAETKHYAVGQTIGVIARGAEQRMRIAGIAKIGGVSSLGGATMAIFDFSVAQRLFGKVGKPRLDLDRGQARIHAGAGRARSQRDPAARARRCARAKRKPSTRRATRTGSSTSSRTSCSRSRASRCSSARS